MHSSNAAAEAASYGVIMYRQHTAGDQMCVAQSAGSTDTSLLWTHYRADEREYCGNRFPDCLRMNDRSDCSPTALLDLTEGSMTWTSGKLLI